MPDIPHHKPMDEQMMAVKAIADEIEIEIVNIEGHPSQICAALLHLLVTRAHAAGPQVSLPVATQMRILADNLTGGAATSVDCPACQGTGEFSDGSKLCPDCHGKGTLASPSLKESKDG